MPTPALHALFGKEMTKEMLLGGQRVAPVRLQESGYTFAHPDLEDAPAPHPRPLTPASQAAR